MLRNPDKSEPNKLQKFKTLEELNELKKSKGLKELYEFN